MIEISFKATNIEKRFNALVAVNKVDMEVRKGEIVGLIGPNGSGKTTLLNCLTGFLIKDGGEVIHQGDDITNLKPYEIALIGIVRTFQISKAFSEVDVLDNLILGAQEHQGDKLWKRVLGTGEIRRKDTATREKGFELLKFLEIEHLAAEKAGSLSGGQRKLLSLGIALMPDPELIMLDEPTAGVNPTLKNKIFDKLIELKDAGKSFVVIEHDLDFVMNLCSRILVLNAGVKIAEGSPEEIQSSERVLEAYIGRD